MSDTSCRVYMHIIFIRLFPVFHVSFDIFVADISAEEPFICPIHLVVYICLSYLFVSFRF